LIIEVGQGAQGRCFKSQVGECFRQVRVSGHECDRSMGAEASRRESTW
jgi:hypothetical protein